MPEIDYGNIGAVWGTALSEDGDYLAVTSGSPDLALSLFYRNELEWRKELGGIAKQVAVSGERVLTGIYSKQGAGSVRMFDLKGKLLWSKRVAKKIESVALSGEYAVAGDNESTVYLFDLQGREIARREVRRWKEPVRVHLLGEVVAAVTRGGDIHLLDMKLNTIRRFSTGMVVGSSALANAHIYLGDYSSPTVRCYDLNGKPLWESTGLSTFSSTISASHGRLIIGTGNGELIAADAEGKLLFRRTIAHPVTSSALNRDFIALGCNDFYVHLLTSAGKMVWSYRLGSGTVKRFGPEEQVYARLQLMEDRIKRSASALESEDYSRLRNGLMNAKRSIQRGDLKAAEKTTTELQTALEEMLTTGLRKRVEEGIKRLSRHEGHFPDLKGVLEIARSQYHAGDYDVAADFLREAEGILAHHQKDIDRLEGAEAVMELAALISEAEKIGLERKVIDDYRRLIEGFRGEMERGIYTDLRKRAESGVRGLKKEIATVLRKRAGVLISRIREEFTALNEDIDELGTAQDAAVEQAKDALLRRLKGVEAEYNLHNYKAVMRDGEGLLRDVTEMRKRMHSSNLMEWHKYLFERIHGLAEYLQMEPEMEMLSTLGDYIEAGNEEEAVKLIKELQRGIDEREGAFFERESRRQIDELTSHLRAGISDSTAWDHLNSARELYSSGHYMEALKEAKAGLEYLRERWDAAE